MLLPAGGLHEVAVHMWRQWLPSYNETPSSPNVQITHEFDSFSEGRGNNVLQIIL
jgi:hypothetical protein